MSIGIDIPRLSKNLTINEAYFEATTSSLLASSNSTLDLAADTDTTEFRDYFSCLLQLSGIMRIIKGM